MAASNKIVKVTKGLTKAEECREDTKLLMQPYANWEEYLSPAPLSIAILAELVFISSNTDFSIRKGGPEGGFKYIKYPDSFRACLMQVCNSGWHAFNDAHKYMDQIRLHTNNVPNYIKMAVQILLQDDDNIVQTMLPAQLDNIRAIADDCLDLAVSTEKRFTDVIELIHELLETCTSAKQVYGEELEEVRKKIHENELRKAAAEEATSRAEQAYKNMSQQLKEAQESFKTAMDSMPSSWDMMKMNFVEGLSSSVVTTLSGFASIVAATGNIATKLSNFGSGKTVQPDAKNDQISANNIYSKSPQILHLVEGLNVFSDGDQIKQSEIIDQETKQPKTNLTKEEFAKTQELIEKEKDCKPKTEDLEIFTKAITIFSELGKVISEEKPDDAKTKQIEEQIESLTNNVLVFDTESKSATNTSALNEIPPQIVGKESFKSAMDSMTSAWEMIRKNSVEGLSSSVTTVLSGSASSVASPGNIPAMIANNGTGKTAQPDAKNDQISANNIYSKSPQILFFVRVLNDFFDGDQIKQSEIIDQEMKQLKTNWIEKEFVKIQESIEKENKCKPKKEALGICTKAITICSELGKVKPEEKSDDAKTKQIVQLMKSLKNKAVKFDTKSKSATNTSAFPVKPPQITKTQENSSGSKSAGEMAVEHARLQIEQKTVQLKEARESYEKCVDNMEENKKKLIEILITMRNCEVKDIDFSTTIKILSQGLEAMGNMKDQWQKLVRFFQMVSNLMKTCLNTSLKDFAQKTDSTSKICNYTSSMFLKDMIYNQAFYASNIASLVNMIAGTYTEVSDKYLMDAVSRLSKLMSLDVSQPEFISEREHMADSCKEADDGIRNLVKNNKQEFERKTMQRLEKIERELKAVLPPESEEKERELKEIVERASKKDQDVDQYS